MGAIMEGWWLMGKDIAHAHGSIEVPVTRLVHLRFLFDKKIFFRASEKSKNAVKIDYYSE